jgi:formylmethanofuran dehydrogenase subunit E
MNYSRPQFRIQGRPTEQWDATAVETKMKGKYVPMIRCKACGKLAPQPPGKLWNKIIRCTRCGCRQSLAEMIEAAS